MYHVVAFVHPLHNKDAFIKAYNRAVCLLNGLACGKVYDNTIASSLNIIDNLADKKRKPDEKLATKLRKAGIVMTFRKCRNTNHNTRQCKAADCGDNQTYLHYYFHI